jgi:pimeloyl-ACP methyl ester carboxylesterase
VHEEANMNRRIGETIWRLSIVILAAMLASCAAIRSKPDFQRLYASARVGTPPPVVVIHGIYGAKLRRRSDGADVWPGGVASLALSNYSQLALQIDPDTLEARDDGIEPYAIFDAIGGSDFYGHLLQTLERAGGYRQAQTGQPIRPGERRYYLFLYDWRRDNIESVRRLDALIAEIRRDYGQPDLRVDIVAHSNGGLIARYYARYGTVDLLNGNEFPVTHAGSGAIRRLILLGTPNFGSLEAAKSLIEGDRAGLRTIPQEVFATTPTAYELLPHALNDWLMSPSGRALDRDIFDIDIWRDFRWGVFDPKVRARIIASADSDATGQQRLAVLERYAARQLERARRFSWSLSVQDDGSGTKPILLGGDCQPTPARLVVENIGDDSLLRFRPRDIKHPVSGVDYERLMYEPGDGRVTKASLLGRQALDPTVPRHPWSSLQYDYVFFLCEKHPRLTGNVSFQDNLLHALLSVDR